MANEEQKQPEMEQGTVDIEQPEAEPAAAADPDTAPADDPAANAGGSGEFTDDANSEVSLEDLIEQLRADAAAAQDAALRAQADAQNVKRRAEKEVEKARKFALEGFSKELLPVVDNLERALEAAASDDEAIKPIAEGVELTLKSFLDALKRFSVEPVDPHGEPFDPQLHQAMSIVANDEVEPNTVIAVMQKGYTLNGRLVRPAMVIVSKKSD